MTPKEKAKEIFEKFYNIKGGHNTMFWDDAIICSLIAVDELIVQIYNIDHQHRAIYNPETGYYSYTDSKELLFWKEVKQEIEKL